MRYLLAYQFPYDGSGCGGGILVLRLCRLDFKMLAKKSDRQYSRQAYGQFVDSGHFDHMRRKPLGLAQDSLIIEKIQNESKSEHIHWLAEASAFSKNLKFPFILSTHPRHPHQADVHVPAPFLCDVAICPCSIMADDPSLKLSDLRRAADTPSQNSYDAT
jgi:hypothetical protein